MAYNKPHPSLHRGTVHMWGYAGYDVAHWRKLYNVINRSVCPTISYTTAYIEVQWMCEAMVDMVLLTGEYYIM